jgi:hypothetical protein
MMQPTHHEYHEYRVPSDHNGAAILSLVCGVLWLLSIITMVLANSVSNAPGASGEALPEQVYTLLQCGVTLLPLVGIVAGGVGLYRAIRQPLPRRSRWLALVGLLLGCLWFITAYIFIG